MGKKHDSDSIEQKHFSLGDIERGIAKLNRRCDEVEKLKPLSYDDQAVDNAVSNIVTSISEIFGPNSREFREHQYHRIWKGSQIINMKPDYCQRCFQAGIPDTQAMLKGLIDRLEEKKLELASPGMSTSYQADAIELHSQIAEVSMPLFKDGHYAQSVFEASKTLVNLVKSKAHSLKKDGSQLMFAAFGGENRSKTIEIYSMTPSEQSARRFA